MDVYHFVPHIYHLHLQENTASALPEDPQTNIFLVLRHGALPNWPADGNGSALQQGQETQAGVRVFCPRQLSDLSLDVLIYQWR